MRSSRNRQAGVSLLELAAAVTILGVLTSTLGYSVLALARGTQSVTQRFLQQNDWQTVKSRIAVDVKASDGVNLDEFGNPYVRVVIVGGTPHLVVRRIEQYVVDAATDTVVPTYGPILKYWHEAGVLYRKHGAVTETIATGVQAADFSVSAQGIVTASISYSPIEKNGAPVLQKFRVRPSNTKSV